MDVYNAFLQGDLDEDVYMEVLEDVGLTGAKPASTPIETNLRLT